MVIGREQNVDPRPRKGDTRAAARTASSRKCNPSTNLLPKGVVLRGQRSPLRERFESPNGNLEPVEPFHGCPWKRSPMRWQPCPDAMLNRPSRQIIVTAARAAGVPLDLVHVRRATTEDEDSPAQARSMLERSPIKVASRASHGTGRRRPRDRVGESFRQAWAGYLSTKRKARDFKTTAYFSAIIHLTSSHPQFVLPNPIPITHINSHRGDVSDRICRYADFDAERPRSICLQSRSHRSWAPFRSACDSSLHQDHQSSRHTSPLRSRSWSVQTP